MSLSIRISDNLAQNAKVESKVMNRSVAGQVEYWARIGKAMQDNPDMTLEFIEGIFRADEEEEIYGLVPYEFG